MSGLAPMHNILQRLYDRLFTPQTILLLPAYFFLGFLLQIAAGTIALAVSQTWFPRLTDEIKSVLFTGSTDIWVVAGVVTLTVLVTAITLIGALRSIVQRDVRIHRFYKTMIETTVQVISGFTLLTLTYALLGCALLLPAIVYPSTLFVGIPLFIIATLFTSASTATWLVPVSTENETFLTALQDAWSRTKEHRTTLLAIHGSFAVLATAAYALLVIFFNTATLLGQLILSPLTAVLLAIKTSGSVAIYDELTHTHQEQDNNDIEEGSASVSDYLT